MANWIGINAAINSGWDMWNKLSAVREAADAKEADAKVGELKQTANADVGNYVDAAKEQKDFANSDMGKLANAFGVQQYDTKRMEDLTNEAKQRGWYGDNGSIDFNKVKEYTSAIPQGDGTNSVSGTFQNDIAKSIDNRDTWAKDRTDAINKDLADSTIKRYRTLGNDVVAARHDYLQKWHPEKVDDEDKYGFNLGFKALGKAITAGDENATNLLLNFHNTMNPDSKLVANGNGSYSMLNAKGEVINPNYTPSQTDFANAMASMYRTYEFLSSGELDKYNQRVQDEQKIKLNNQAITKGAIDVSNAQKFGERNAQAESDALVAKAQGAQLDNTNKGYAIMKNEAESKFYSSNAEADHNQKVANVGKTLAETGNIRANTGLTVANTGLTIEKTKRQKIDNAYAPEQIKADIFSKMYNKMDPNPGSGVKYVDDPAGGGQIATSADGRKLFRVDANGNAFTLDDPKGNRAAEIVSRLKRSPVGDAFGEVKPDEKTGDYKILFTSTVQKNPKTGKPLQMWLTPDEIPMAVSDEAKARKMKAGPVKVPAKQRGYAVPPKNDGPVYGTD